MSSEDVAQDLSSFKQCSVCGLFSGAGTVCHPDRYVAAERALNRGKSLFVDEERPETVPIHIGAFDRVPFTFGYAAMQSIGDANVDTFTELSPFDVADEPLFMEAYRAHHVNRDSDVYGVEAAIRAVEKACREGPVEVEYWRIFQVVVLMAQLGLIPMRMGLDKVTDIKAACEEYWGTTFPVDSPSETTHVVKRRIDRQVVWSTTPALRAEAPVTVHEGVEAMSSPASVAGADGLSVVGDHRDHNIIVAEAKQQVESLPGVDWASAPHVFTVGVDGASVDSAVMWNPDADSEAVFSFDFAGFADAGQGSELRYLGVVTDPEESLDAVLRQVRQIERTQARGIVIMPSRDDVYAFLDHVRVHGSVPLEWRVDAVNPDRYRRFENVGALHRKVIWNLPLLEDFVFVPRRRFSMYLFNRLNELFRRGFDA